MKTQNNIKIKSLGFGDHEILVNGVRIAKFSFLREHTSQFGVVCSGGIMFTDGTLRDISGYSYFKDVKSDILSGHLIKK